MTEQEAEVFAARLRRIWDVIAPVILEITGPVAIFNTSLSKDVQFRVTVVDGASTYYALHETGADFTLLACDDSDVTDIFKPYFWHPNFVDPQHSRQLEWMPSFRRGLFLSGVPIEATAHEKAEWMQGFSREELELWNLKI
ncbi:hypothetical protein EON83_15015 [bacterium]|nr:MAG: hypothetical protein EON83_15015 [bacterium]